MLSAGAGQLLHDYLNLPFTGIPGVRCPYFNNARVRDRAELRALVGKGTPQEIVEEVKIASLQYHPGPLAAPEDLRRFMIDHRLGIECSGFVTQVLLRHYQEQQGVTITKKMILCERRRLLRRLICRLRPVENISVKTYTDNRNTAVISSYSTGWNYGLIKPGDVITMLETGTNKRRNHIMLITEATIAKLQYIHARAWPSEGRYGHGVAAGTIIIVKPDQGLLEQAWSELGKTGQDNETYLEAKNANIIEIRRLIL